MHQSCCVVSTAFAVLMKTKYSDFNVYLPSDPSPAPTAVESEVPIVSSGEQPGLADGAGISVEDRGTIRILIVDDDRTLREGCASVLQVEGYNVNTCGRGDEALEMIRRAHYDIVMVDLYMTPIPGLEILKSVLTIRPGTIVLVMGNQGMASAGSASPRRVGLYTRRFLGASAGLLGRAAHAVLLRDASPRSSSRGSSTATTISSLLGTSAAHRRVVELARKVAFTAAPVARGRAGTKEMIAQFVPAQQPRDPAIVPLSCAGTSICRIKCSVTAKCFPGADRKSWAAGNGERRHLLPRRLTECRRCHRPAAPRRAGRRPVAWARQQQRW
jgi:CheY-like chemotaxis protein